MTARKYVTIWCDGKRSNGDQCINWTDGAQHHVGLARRDARREGWRCDRSGDFCPRCSTRRPRHD